MRLRLHFHDPWVSVVATRLRINFSEFYTVPSAVVNSYVTAAGPVQLSLSIYARTVDVHSVGMKRYTKDRFPLPELTGRAMLTTRDDGYNGNRD